MAEDTKTIKLRNQEGELIEITEEEVQALVDYLVNGFNKLVEVLNTLANELNKLNAEDFISIYNQNLNDSDKKSSKNTERKEASSK